MEEKKRAPRNKTLTVDQDEYVFLSNKLKKHNSNQPLSIENILNSTMHGDTLNIIEDIPANTFDLVIIDPPYNLNKNYNGFQFKSRSDDAYIDYLRAWFPSVVKTLKENGSLYLCGDWKCTASLQMVMSENLDILNRITWQREKGRGAKTNWKNSMEDIWFGVKNKKNYYFNVDAVKQKRKVIAPYRVNGKPKDWQETEEGNFRITHPSNFWDDISVPYWSMPENTDHPTQKPEKLIAKLILASCPENGLVFDPFLGSGTTSVVAKKLGRRYFGIELNEEYAVWAEKRLQKSESDTRVQGYSDGVFWERNTLSIQKRKK
ncbi:DNA methyltransferase [Anaerolineales bacterium HSG6]|nr:DNA methyltransferase [Anaerolineales bacterium HSG6]